MLAMFQLPNRFFETDGGQVDMLGQDWARAWGDAARSAGAPGEG